MLSWKIDSPLELSKTNRLSNEYVGDSVYQEFGELSDLTIGPRPNVAPPMDIFG